MRLIYCFTCGIIKTTESAFSGFLCLRSFFCFQFVFSNCRASSFRGGQARSELSIRTRKMRYILGPCPGMTSRRLYILLGFVTDEAAEVVYAETGSRKWVVKGLGQISSSLSRPWGSGLQDETLAICWGTPHDDVMPFCYLPPFDMTCIMKANRGQRNEDLK